MLQSAMLYAPIRYALCSNPLCSMLQSAMKHDPMVCSIVYGLGSRVHGMVYGLRRPATRPRGRRRREAPAWSAAAPRLASPPAPAWSAAAPRLASPPAQLQHHGSPVHLRRGGFMARNMVYGLWSMVYGLWSMVYGRGGAPLRVASCTVTCSELHRYV